MRRVMQKPGLRGTLTSDKLLLLLISVSKYYKVHKYILINKKVRVRKNLPAAICQYEKISSKRVPTVMEKHGKNLVMETHGKVKENAQTK